MSEPRSLGANNYTRGRLKITIVQIRGVWKWSLFLSMGGAAPPRYLEDYGATHDEREARVESVSGGGEVARWWLPIHPQDESLTKRGSE